MFTHPTLERLRTLRLNGMADALAEQAEHPDVAALSFEERLGLLVDREASERDSRRLTSRLRQARLRQSAAIEDIDYVAARGLDKAFVRSLARCAYVTEHQNVLLVGPTGTGKTYIACALAHKACLEGYTARYYRLSTLLAELEIARADGRYAKLMRELTKTDVLILDDWGLAPVSDRARTLLLEVLDDRHGHSSTIVTSQLPIEHWHATIGEATIADAILDRLVHNAHKIELTGDSMRRKRSNLAKPPSHTDDN
jgi:DNA replication protein DnaC